MSQNGVLIIDGEGHVAGRLASIIAKRLLRGERIIVVNAEKIIITGKKKRVLSKFLKRISEWRTYYNPEKRGPKYPRAPDRIFKRMVRGMLPHKRSKGREALKRLKVYVGVPREYRDVEKIKIDDALFKNEFVPYVTLGQIYEEIAQKKIEEVM
ncbi:MAG: 50S ribosomal protein L13 [Thermoprotei archaeon]|nr:MAG: 50S ribosomal protein L13 [Thermoprotei archaeon]